MLFPTTAAFFAALTLAFAQQSFVPSDLSSGFDPGSITLQVLYSDASKTDLHGVLDGAPISQKETSQVPGFALGDASAINPNLVTMILLVDTTSSSDRALHFLQTDFSATEDATSISTSKAPLVPYAAPGTLGEPTGTRKYSWLMFQQPFGFKPAEAVRAGDFNVQTFISDNKLQPALAGLEMVVPISAGIVGSSAAASTTTTTTTLNSSSNTSSTSTSVSTSALISTSSTSSSIAVITAAAAASTSSSSATHQLSTSQPKPQSSTQAAASQTSQSSVPFITLLPPSASQTSTSASDSSSEDVSDSSSSSSTLSSHSTTSSSTSASDSAAASDSGVLTSSLPPVTLTTVVGASRTAAVLGSKTSFSSGSSVRMAAGGMVLGILGAVALV